MFGEEEDEAWMIDFDLAGQEGTRYPATYNDKLSCRHPQARPLARRKREHDIHSLVYILQNNFRSRQVEVDKYTFTLV